MNAQTGRTYTARLIFNWLASNKLMQEQSGQGQGRTRGGPKTRLRKDGVCEWLNTVLAASPTSQFSRAGGTLAGNHEATQPQNVPMGWTCRMAKSDPCMQCRSMKKVCSSKEKRTEKKKNWRLPYTPACLICYLSAQYAIIIARFTPFYLTRLPSPLDRKTRALKIKQLPEFPHGVVWALHAVPRGSRVLVNLVVVAALVGLVAEEVDGCVVDAIREVLLVLDVLQAVRLVPAIGEDVKGDLTTNGVAESGVGQSRGVGTVVE